MYLDSKWVTELILQQFHIIGFAGFVLTVFPHVGCSRLGTNGGGDGGDLLVDITYSLDLVYMSTFISKILKICNCSV